MSTPVVLSEEPWNYVLFREDQRTLLTFMLGGAVEVDCTVALTQTEAQSVEVDASAIGKLIAELRANPNQLEARLVKPPRWPKK